MGAWRWTREDWAYSVSRCWWLDRSIHLLCLGVATCIGRDEDDRVVDDDVDAAFITLVTLAATALVFRLCHLHGVHSHGARLLALLTLLALLILLILLHVT